MLVVSVVSTGAVGVVGAGAGGGGGVWLVPVASGQKNPAPDRTEVRQCHESTVLNQARTARHSAFCRINYLLQTGKNSPTVAGASAAAFQTKTGLCRSPAELQGGGGGEVLTWPDRLSILGPVTSLRGRAGAVVCRWLFLLYKFS